MVPNLALDVPKREPKTVPKSGPNLGQKEGLNLAEKGLDWHAIDLYRLSFDRVMHALSVEHIDRCLELKQVFINQLGEDNAQRVFKSHLLYRCKCGCPEIVRKQSKQVCKCCGSEVSNAWKIN